MPMSALRTARICVGRQREHKGRGRRAAPGRSVMRPGGCGNKAQDRHRADRLALTRSRPRSRPSRRHRRYKTRRRRRAPHDSRHRSGTRCEDSRRRGVPTWAPRSVSTFNGRPTHGRAGSSLSANVARGRDNVRGGCHYAADPIPTGVGSLGCRWRRHSCALSHGCASVHPCPGKSFWRNRVKACRYKHMSRSSRESRIPRTFLASFDIAFYALRIYINPQ